MNRLSSLIVSVVFISTLGVQSAAQTVDSGRAIIGTDNLTLQLPIRSWKTLREQQIVKQRLDYSCGAASVATLLNAYFGQSVSEDQVLRAMHNEDGKATFDDLQKGIAKLGFKAIGFASTWGQLTRIRSPIIVYVENRKGGHFSVLKGISEKTVHLADPSSGNRTYSSHQFREMWETRLNTAERPDLQGKFLVVLPGEVKAVPSRTFFTRIPRRQSAPIIHQLGTRPP